MTYNGHANYETWNVCLWVDNEYPLYLKKVRLLDRVTKPITAEYVKGFVDGYMGGITPDVVDPDDMLKVDWGEIAESWETERQEQILYRLGAANQYETVDDYLSDKAAEIQDRLAPYDLGIDDDDIRELLLEEDGDIERIVSGYLEDVEPLREDPPVHLGKLVDLDGPNEVDRVHLYIKNDMALGLEIEAHESREAAEHALIDALQRTYIGEYLEPEEIADVLEHASGDLGCSLSSEGPDGVDLYFFLRSLTIEVVEQPMGKAIWTSDEVTI